MAKKNKKKAEDTIGDGMDVGGFEQMIRKMAEENPEAMQSLMNLVGETIFNARGDDDRKTAKKKKSLESKFQKSPKQFELLAELAAMEDDTDKRIEILRRTVQAAEAANPKFARSDVALASGKKTDAYLDALFALANDLLFVDEIEESISRLKELLLKDPDDFRGAHRILLETYCRQNQVDEAEDLADDWRQADDSPFVHMTFAVLRLAKTGPSPELHEIVVEQLRSNPHLAPFLLGNEEPDVDPWDETDEGSPREAEEYSRMFRTLWRSTPGALNWLKEIHEEILPELTQDDLEEEIEELFEEALELRKSRQVWYCHLHKVQGASKAIGENELLLCLVKVGEQDKPICMENVDRDLAPQLALRSILIACVEPEDGEPVRPKTIQFMDAELAQELTDSLARCDIKVAVVAEPPEAVRMMIEQGFGLREYAWDSDVIADLPVPVDTTWEVDWQQLNDWIPGPNGEFIQPWVLMIASHEGAPIRATRVDMKMPDEETFRSLFAQAILAPMGGEPGRPSVIEVRQPNLRIPIRDIAAELGVDVVVGPCLILTTTMAEMPRPGRGHAVVETPMIEAEGVTPQLMEELFVASAEFYRSRVFSRIRPELVLELKCSEISPQEWYVVTMGQNGQEIGLTLIASLNAVRSMLSGIAYDPDDQTSLMTGITYTLDSKQLQSPKDVSAAEQFGWPVPGPEAWPKVIRMTKGNLFPAELDELLVSVVAIRAILHAFGKSRGEFPLNVALGDRTVTVSGRVLDLSRS